VLVREDASFARSALLARPQRSEYTALSCLRRLALLNLKSYHLPIVRAAEALEHLAAR
jgi:hypothetical protein